MDIAYALSEDRLTLVIKRRTTAGILTATFNRGKLAGPFTEADVKWAISELPAASRTMEPGQRNRARRFVTRFGTLYLHLMTGPPTWWMPRLMRDRGGAIVTGWLGIGVAVKLARND